MKMIGGKKIMVKIDDEYIINANESCYTLEKISNIEDTDSKNYGKEVRTIQKDIIQA